LVIHYVVIIFQLISDQYQYKILKEVEYEKQTQENKITKAIVKQELGKKETAVWLGGVALARPPQVGGLLGDAACRRQESPGL